mgnify:CR=1 FL=1
MSDKTKPYEIREHLLHLAENILRENARMKMAASGDKEYIPYTVEDVVDAAKKLNEFVTKA